MKPRFTIAHFLLFTAVVGLIIGWQIDRRQLSQRYQSNKSVLTSLISDSQATERNRLATYDALMKYSEQRFHALNTYDRTQVKEYLARLLNESDLRLGRLNRLENQISSGSGQ